MVYHKRLRRTTHFGYEDNGCSFCHIMTVERGMVKVTSVSDNSGCIDCHTNSVEFSNNGPHAEQACIDCHDPHQSDYAALMRGPSIVLCTESCHGPEHLGRSHPIGQSITDSRTGNEMTCISTCHQVHKPNSEKLLTLTTPDLCVSCHQEKY